MAVLIAGIDARTAKAGASDFSSAANQIKRDAGGVTQEIDRQEDSLDDLSAGFGRFKVAIAALGLGLLASSLIDTADAMTLADARLGLVTETSAEFTAVQIRLFDQAQETRQEFVNLIDVYGRFARSTRDLDISQSALLQSTELINKSIILSGATSAESSSALIQLSQGFAAGALRGDEFRSVSEQLPAILTAVSDGLGVTRGELRAMAFEGELTAERFFEGLNNSAEQIRREFELMPTTVEQASTRIGNSIDRIIGRLNAQTEATGLLAAAMLEFEGIIDGIGSVLVPTLQQEIDLLKDLPLLLDFIIPDDVVEARIRDLQIRVTEESARQAAALRGAPERDLGPFGIPPRRSDIPDEDFARILDQNAKAAADAAKAERDLAEAQKESRTKSAEALADASEFLRQKRVDLREATLALEEREQSLADQIIDRNLTAQERYNDSLFELEAIRHRLTEDEFAREFARLNEELQESDPLFQSIVSRADQFATAIASAMSQAAIGTQSWNDALQDVAASILQIAANIAIEESIRKIFSAVAEAATADSGGGATGGAATGPPIDITGGIGSGNTVQFSQRSVPQNGGPQVQVNITNNGAPAEATAEVTQADQDVIRVDVLLNEVASDVRNGGTVGRAIGQSFSLNRTPKQV